MTNSVSFGAFSQLSW